MAGGDTRANGVRIFPSREYYAGSGGLFTPPSSPTRSERSKTKDWRFAIFIADFGGGETDATQGTSGLRGFDSAHSRAARPNEQDISGNRRLFNSKSERHRDQLCHRDRGPMWHTRV